MRAEIKNFVGIYEDAFSKEYCDKTIAAYESVIAMGFAWNRQEGLGRTQKTRQDDVSYHTSSIFSDAQAGGIPISDVSTFLGGEFNDIFWQKCYADYSGNFSVLSENTAVHTIFSNKIQKTSVGGGYHEWHYENGTRDLANRLAAYIVYLNDVEEGGETEFLYYPMRVKPKAGTCIIFPAGYTHTHRGNPPISNNKYILTGWLEL